MRDKTTILVSILVAALMLSMTLSTSLAFINPDGSQDNYFEIFGPRVDQILVKKYAGTTAVVDALKAGEIDITDWALTRSQIDDLAAYSDTINVVGYGGEAGYYTMSYNMNPNQYLGNPPEEIYPNPKYNNNPTTVYEFREGCSYLLDRPALSTGPGQGLYEPIYTPIPAYMGFWIHPEISYTGLLSDYAYPPSVTDAAAAFEAGHFILTDSPDGYRYWDKNENNAYDGASEDLVIDLVSRSTDPLRRGAADMLIAAFGLEAIKIKVIDTLGDGGISTQKVMREKNYHIYTSGWIFIGPDPDYLYDLYHWANYWHPTNPPNFGAVSQYNPALQTALEGIKYSASAEDALEAALTMQELFAAEACETPLASTSSPKAYYKTYTGGNGGELLGDAEDKYRGLAWEQIVNEKGQGENSFYTTLNAYPGTYQYGDGNMIMRYGWSDNSMPVTLNPMYSSWYWESEAWARCYDGLGGRDPMTKGPIEIPAVAENWTLGTWTSGSDTLTKVTVKIRSDVEWSDGVPLTIEDVIYTFIDMPAELRAKGCPDVWWQPTLDRIVGFFRLDAYTIEVLLDVNTYLGANWIAGNVVIPKHIWQPFIATGTTEQITGDLSADPSKLIGNGPFIYEANTAETLLLVRNPNYYQTMDKSVTQYEQFDVKVKQGITVVATAPAEQLTPFKVKPAGTPPTADVHVTVPITNLDHDDEQDFSKQIVVTGPGGIVYDTGLLLAIWLDPLAVHIEDFDLNDLPPGIYTIAVTVEVTSGPLFEWVTAELDPALWPMILGPRTIEKRFWVTILPDLNEDCVVDIFDIVIIGLRFGTSFGDLNYSPQADVNRDFLVDIFDIVQVALVFGWNT